MLLSSAVLGVYQWEEVYNYAAKWEKFRIVAEQLKSERHLFEQGAGRYRDSEERERHREFVEHAEAIIKGTDLSYFSLLVEPGKRIEKRLETTDGRVDS